MSRCYARVALSGVYNRGTGCHSAFDPECNQTNLHLRRLRVTVRLLRKPTNIFGGLASSFFRLVSILLFFPTLGWCSFPSGPTVQSPPRLSNIFIPREMSKQKERRVHKKIVFRSSIVPRKSILLFFLTTLPPSILPFQVASVSPWSSSTLSGPGYSFL